MLHALELYTGAGAADAWAAAGRIHVTGVDIKPQPNSAPTPSCRPTRSNISGPPILGFSISSGPRRRASNSLRAARSRTKAHLDLIAPTRALLVKSGKPYCIENVVGAPLRSGHLMRHDVRLAGADPVNCAAIDCSRLLSLSKRRAPASTRFDPRGLRQPCSRSAPAIRDQP